MKHEQVRSTIAQKDQQMGSGSDKKWTVNYESMGQATQFGGASCAWRGQAPIVDRFWRRVNKNGSVPSHCRHLGACWQWTGCVVARYGQISLGHPSQPGSNRWKTHRFSWELHNGPIPPSLKVCHKCDNPLCVNPSHLFVGTQADNMRDAVCKGRKGAWGLQKLNADDVRVIREQAARGLLQKDIAAAFGIARNTVSGIVHRKSWAHLDDLQAQSRRRA